MQPLVECVPNFSNGRDPAVYGRIADAIREVAGVQVLDVSADPDHNRTVITFVGGPDDVVEAAFRGISVARDLIDLDHHQGEHPRIGATDVCPFIPVRGITTEACVTLARRLGKRVGEELGVAVYLYGAAATRPERESLADIRKGQYELWKEEVVTDPRRTPDSVSYTHLDVYKRQFRDRSPIWRISIPQLLTSGARSKLSLIHI